MVSVRRVSVLVLDAAPLVAVYVLNRLMVGLLAAPFAAPPRSRVDGDALLSHDASRCQFKWEAAA